MPSVSSCVKSKGNWQRNGCWVHRLKQEKQFARLRQCQINLFLLCFRYPNLFHDWCWFEIQLFRMDIYLFFIYENVYFDRNIIFVWAMIPSYIRPVFSRVAIRKQRSALIAAVPSRCYTQDKTEWCVCTNKWSPSKCFPLLPSISFITLSWKL